MSRLIWELVISFLATVSFAIVFNVPVRYLLPGGLAGMVGWLIYRVLGEGNMAIFLASLGIGAMAEMGARIFRVPTLIIAVPGMIPLVPGAGAYDTMMALVRGEFTAALAKGTETFFAAGAIALGIALATVPLRFVQKGGGQNVRKDTRSRFTAINSSKR